MVSLQESHNCFPYELCGHKEREKRVGIFLKPSSSRVCETEFISSLLHYPPGPWDLIPHSVWRTWSWPHLTGERKEAVGEGQEMWMESSLQPARSAIAQQSLAREDQFLLTLQGNRSSPGGWWLGREAANCSVG